MVEALLYSRCSFDTTKPRLPLQVLERHEVEVEVALVWRKYDAQTCWTVQDRRDADILIAQQNKTLKRRVVRPVQYSDWRLHPA